MIPFILVLNTIQPPSLDNFLNEHLQTLTLKLTEKGDHILCSCGYPGMDCPE